MNSAGKGKSVSMAEGKPISRRRFPGYVTTGLGTIMAAPVSWLAAAVVTVIVVAGLLTGPQTLTVNAALEPAAPLDCLSCHQKVLQGHDKLGSGSEACWVCHYNMKMGVLHLADETQFPLSDSPRLCAQCHQKRYEAWREGTHGVPAWKEESPEIRGTKKVRCTGCHDPHQPQIAFLNITKPHPTPAPPPSPPLDTPLVLVVSSLLVAMAIGVFVTRKGAQG